MKIAVSGATGRMGKLIIEAVLCSNDLELVAAVTAPEFPKSARMPVRQSAKRPGF